MSHAARLAVPAQVDELYDWLRHVEDWPRFLEGLEAVEPLGYHRYRWTITYAGRTSTCDVTVSLDPHDHRISWKHHAGAPFDGVMRLFPVSDRRTEVDLFVNIKPQGLIDGVLDFSGRGGWLAERDLQRLREVVAHGGLASSVPAGSARDDDRGDEAAV